MAARRPAADEPQPIPSGIWLSMRIRNRPSGAPFLSTKPTIDVQAQVVFEPRAALCIAPGRRNGELGRRLGLHIEIEIERDGRGIESRPQVGRGRRQAQPNTSIVRLGDDAHPAEPFTAANTAAGVASTEIALRRRRSICVSKPAASSSLKSVPRWKSMV